MKSTPLGRNQLAWIRKSWAKSRARRAPELVIRAGWLGLILLTVTLFSVALPVRYFQLLEFRFAKHSEAEILRVVQPGGVQQALVDLGLPVDVYAFYIVLLEALVAIVFGTVALVAWRKRRELPWAMYVTLTLVVFGMASLPTMNALSEVDPFFGDVDRLLNTAGWTLIGLFYYLFPDGRVVLRWTKPLAVAWVIWQLGYAFFPESAINPLRWPPPVALSVWVAWFATGVYAQVYRYLRVSTPVERQQTKWVLFGWSAAFATGVVVHLPGVIYPDVTMPGHPGPLYELLRGPFTYLATLIAPVSLGMAMLRYRLWDIDLIINRTLVYIPLTAVVTGLYSGTLVLTTRIFIALTGASSDLVIVFVTLIFATGAASLRTRLQTLVDRYFREAPDPTRGLRAIGDQVRRVVDTVDQRELAARFLREAVRAVAAKSGAIYLWRDEQWQQVERHGDWDEDGSVLSIPLAVDGVSYGRLYLGPRLEGEVYGEREKSALAHTASIVAQAIRATSPQGLPRGLSNPI